jgi:hypothetical protein
MLIGGMGWIAIMSTFNVAAQLTVPAWVRARALAVYGIVAQGGVAVGSAFWGGVAERLSLTTTLLCAAAALALGLTVALRYRLRLEKEIDFSPSAHWPEPVLAQQPHPDAGPVLITVEYRIDSNRAQAFAAAMHGLRSQRLRDGAYRWGLYNDSAVPTRFIETFVVESWAEHLRQHNRVTVADRAAEDIVRAFHLGDQAPVISHFIYVRAAMPKS